MANDEQFPAWTEIDLSALAANYRTVQRLIGADVRVIASVKADAYGCGAVEVSRAFQDLGAFALATGTVREAVAIREAGVGLPILLFSTYLPDEVPGLLAYDFIPTVHDPAVAEAISRAAPEPRAVYVKVDAGLGRLGIPLDEAAAAIRRIAAMPDVTVEGVYTHVPFGSRRGRSWAADRLRDFDRLIAALADKGLEVPVTQARASSCVLAGLEDQCNAVCMGHAFYGLSPYGEDGIADLSRLRPVVRSLKTRLIQVAHHGQGSDLGVAELYGLKTGRTAGVVPLGLSSGFLRTNRERPAQVLVGGRRAPIIAVSLEHMTIDLDDVEDARTGDTVTLVGRDGDDEITLGEAAGWHGRRPLEVLQMLAGRTRRECV